MRLNRYLLLLVLLLSTLPLLANERVNGWCQNGGAKAQVGGFVTSLRYMASYPKCTVTVYYTGTTTTAPLYSDNSGTILSNPFTALADGTWSWYAANGHYDVTMSGGEGGGFPIPLTLSDILLCDGCGGGGGGGITVQTNGVPNSIQTTLNLVSGLGVSATNSGANVQFNSTGAFPLTSTLGAVTSPTEGEIFNITDSARGQYLYKNALLRPTLVTLNPLDWGARNDGGWYSQVQCTSGSGVIQNVAALGGRLPLVGDTFIASGCGAAGTDLQCILSAVSGFSFGTVTCGGGVTAAASLTNRGARWRSVAQLDDSTAFTNMFNYCSTNASNGGCHISVPCGIYFLNQATFPAVSAGTLLGQIFLEGQGRDCSNLVGIGANHTPMLIAPANSVPTRVEGFTFLAYDGHNSQQIAVQWQGGTQHVFANNKAWSTYEMVNGANTWFNLVWNNYCYAVSGDCVEWGGAAGVGPVNQTNVIANQFVGFGGWAYNSHTNSASWSNTVTGNDTEQDNPPFVGLYNFGNENRTKFVGGYLEETPSVATSGFDVIVGNSGSFDWAGNWPCTEIKANSSANIFGTASGTNPCAAPHAPFTFVPIGATYSNFYGALGNTIENYGTVGNTNAMEMNLYGSFRLLEGSGSFSTNPYKTSAMEWTSSHGGGAELSMSYAAGVANTPVTTPNTTSGAVYSSGILSSIVWNRQLNNAAASPLTSTPVLGWACLTGSCVSTGSGGYSSGSWGELGIARTRKIRECTAAPVTGTWTAGDFCQNTSPATSIYGWLNILAGTPGTWVPLLANNLPDPGSTGIVKRTTANTTTIAANTDVLGLWTGTCNSTTFLRGDGSCQTPSGVGTVTSFSSGNLSPLFTTSVATSTTTPALTFVLSTAAAHAFLGNNTGSTAAPAYVQPAFTDLSGNIATGQMNSGTSASSSTFWRGDGVWATPAGAGNVTTGTLTSGIIPKATGATAIADGSLTDNGSGITTTESAAVAGSASKDILYADSTAHRWKMNNNNGGAVQVVASGVDINASDQVTATHLAAALPIAQGGTGNSTTVAAHTYFGNNTGSSAAPAFLQPAFTDLSGALVAGQDYTAGMAAGTGTKLTTNSNGRVTTVASAALASADFANQGTTTTILHGNAAGNPSWAAVSLVNDVTGNLPVANLNSGTSASSATFWRGDGTWATPAGSGTINVAGQFAAAYYSAAGSTNTLSGIAAPTAPSNVPQYFTSLNSSGAAAAPSWTLAGVAGRNVSGASDTILVTDRTGWVTYSSASATAVTLPQAGSTGFASNFVFGLKTTGAGTVTVTPTTSTIDGASTLVIPQGQNCSITSLDNTNYVSRCAAGLLTAGTNITITPSANGIQLSSTAGGGNVNNSGTPTNGQIAQWTNSTTIQGLATTGSGNAVLATSPTLVTPTIGVATATSVNKVAITAPATSATLTIANGKTLTASNTVTFTGTDGASLNLDNAVTAASNFASGGLVAAAGANKTLASADLTGAVTTSAGLATSPGKIDVLDSSAFCTAAGASGSAYTCNLSPAISAYVTGTHYRFKADVANTGAATINFNSLGAITIKKPEGGSITADIAANDLRAGQWVELFYDGTNMQMASQVGNSPAGSGTVNSGTAGNLAYYATSTNAVSDAGVVAANVATASSAAGTANQVAISAGANKALSYATADTTTTHAFFATAGAPAFRAIAAGDIPTLNQNTTGTASNLSGTPALPNGTTATTQSAADNSTKLATTAYADAAGATKAVNLASGTSVSLTGPSQVYVCTGTCTVTPPVPVAGYQFCVFNGDNVATVITLAALGSSSRYENTARTSYGTAATGTLVSGGAVGDSVCILGLDSTHYLTVGYNGTWVAN